LACASQFDENTARTIARSSRHRLMLAIYGGFAFALSLTFSGGLLNAMKQPWMLAEPSRESLPRP
jgi:hypothetical protein